jgi:hypothetical protein
MDWKYFIFPNSHLQYPCQANAKSLRFFLHAFMGHIKNIIYDLIHLCITLINDVKPSCLLLLFSYVSIVKQT